MNPAGSSDTDLLRAVEELPLFPLPQTVFFPHTLLPLHVFEPRYRQMTEHVIATHKHMAVVRIDDARGDAPVPGVAPVAGVGRVVHHERLPDGRFHILLQGIARVELIDELPRDDRLYRRARATVIEAQDEGAAAEQEVRTLRSCYARLLEACPQQKDVLGDLLLRVGEPRILADVICAALLSEGGVRQMALEEASVTRRLQLANDALAMLLLQNITPEAVGLH